MADRRVVLAVGAHPDDVEFNMAGTLALLVQAGFEPHIFTVSRSECDSNVLPPDQISRIRMDEAQRSAAVIGATHHPGIVNDCMIFYNEPLLRQVTGLVRQVDPDIVLLPSLNDYMEDHTNTARLVVTACFVRGMKNFVSDPPHGPVSKDVFLYHAQPHLNRDGMREVAVPTLVVDIGSAMPTKERMLMCFDSQTEWLSETQGLSDIAATMREACAEVARMTPPGTAELAEGWRPHSHVGFSAEDRDLLGEVLGDPVTRL